MLNWLANMSGNLVADLLTLIIAFGVGLALVDRNVNSHVSVWMEPPLEMRTSRVAFVLTNDSTHTVYDAVIIVDDPVSGTIRRYPFTSKVHKKTSMFKEEKPIRPGESIRSAELFTPSDNAKIEITFFLRGRQRVRRIQPPTSWLQRQRQEKIRRKRSSWAVGYTVEPMDSMPAEVDDQNPKD